MSTRDPEVTYTDPVQSVPFAIEAWARQNLHTAMPGIVRAYDADDDARPRAAGHPRHRGATGRRS